MAKLKNISTITRMVYAKGLGRNFRNGIKEYKDLKPASFRQNDGVIRYDWHELVSIINYHLAGNIRDYSSMFHNYKEVCKSTTSSSLESHQSTVSDDMWSQFYIKMFRAEVRNGQVNTIYMGLDTSYLYKRLKRFPTEYELVIHMEFIKIFKDIIVNDRIKVEVWW